MLKYLDLGIAIRAGTVGIRFLLPVLVLAIANQEELGRYYLYTAAIALIIFSTTCEINLFFSKAYVQDPSQSLIFQHFIGLLTTALILNTTFGSPILVSFLWWSGERDFKIYVAFFYYLNSEVVVNEYGRYLTNISKVNSVVFRDLYRAISLVLSALISLASCEKIVTWEFFLAFGLFNTALLLFEYFYARSFFNGTIPNFELSNNIRTTIAAIRQTRGAIAQSAISYFYPLFERIILERTVGLSTLGGYALLTSLIQAAVSVLFLPTIARFRTTVLQLHSCIEKKGSLEIPGLTTFMLKVLGTGTILILSLQFTVSLGLLEGKFDVDVWFSIAALVGVASSNVMYVVSPDYARVGRIYSSMLITISIYTCTLLSLFMYAKLFSNNHIFISSILTGGFFVQILVRQRYLKSPHLIDSK
ncbi:MAG: hypothetical protein QE278_07740 [Limnobacter sp.]|nr:hypothetical protein [Limnobacter sp.]